ncbi:MAG: hypothetical protein WDW36_008477 [Sanguina aurantia]
MASTDGHMLSIGEDEDELEMNEEDLFDELESPVKGHCRRPVQVESDEDEEDTPTAVTTPTLLATAMDLGSGKSSTLALEDSMLSPMQGGAAGANRAIPGWSMPPRQLPTPHATITQSLPAHKSHIRMGSSVPIGIPLTGVRGFNAPPHLGSAQRAHGHPAASAHGSTPPEDSPRQAGGQPLPFIPPPRDEPQRRVLLFVHSRVRAVSNDTDDGGCRAHAVLTSCACMLVIQSRTLSSDDEQGGDSPAAGLKRDKLRQRNAILISTGFLETGAMAIGGAGKPGAARGLNYMTQHTGGNFGTGGGYDASSVPASSGYMSVPALVGAHHREAHGKSSQPQLSADGSHTRPGSWCVREREQRHVCSGGVALRRGQTPAATRRLQAERSS